MSSHAVAVRGRRAGRLGGRPRARHALPELGKADPGASAPAGATPIWTTPRSRSPAPRTSRAPSSSSAVRSLLAKAPASEEDLECGPEPTRLEHNCSGKHAGDARALSRDGVADRGLPAARAPVPAGDARDEIAAAAEVDAGRRCRPPSTAAASRRSRFRSSGWRTPSRGSTSSKGRSRIIGAMRAHPDLIRGPQAADTVLMQTQPGWVAKGGAEGLLCAVSADGLGVALKIEDGSQRAIRPAAASSSRRSGSTPASSDVSPSRTHAARWSASSAQFENKGQTLVMSLVDESSENCCECRDRTYAKWPSRIRMRRLVAEPVRRRKSRLAR